VAGLMVERLLKSNKYARVEQLKRFGLNTPDYDYFSRGSYERWVVYVLSLDGVLPRSHRVSVRFFGNGDSLMGTQPHMPNVSWAEAKTAINEHLADYSIMLAIQAIQPDDTIVCGNLMMEAHGIDGYGVAFFEYRYGAGTVRDVQGDCTSLVCNLHEFPRDPNTGEFVHGLARAKHAALKFPYWNHVIFEWSFYPYGLNIGWKHQPLIFWECRRQR